jgi:hypothetical protein
MFLLQTGAHPAQQVVRLFPWVKTARALPHPSNAEVKNSGTIPPLPIHLHSVMLNYSEPSDNISFVTIPASPSSLSNFSQLRT